jgi:hypothetical protein
MAVNYMEDGTLAEPAPINAFMKSASAIIGDCHHGAARHGGDHFLRVRRRLAVVIGKRASHGPLSKSRA